MKNYLIVLFLCLSGFAVHANDGVFYARGNTLIPVKETVVRMDKEVLSLKQDGKDVLVKVEFDFFNPGPEKTETVGFVTPPAAGDFDEREAQHPQIRDFTVLVNGKSIEYKVFRMEGSGFHLNDGIANGDDFIYHFPTTFKHGLNKVIHTYKFRASESVDIEYDVDYRLTTGTQWAGGKIGDFTLNIEMEANTYFSFPWSFQENGVAADWKIDGTGRMGNSKNGLFEISMRSARIVEGKLTFHQKDFRPEQDLFVLIIPFYNSLSMWTDNGQSHDFQKLYEYLMPYSVDDLDFAKLNNEELRLLRNFPYAWEGYAFKSADLDKYFRKFNWYVPIPDKSIDQIKISSEMMRMVEKIKKIEAERK